MSSEPSLSRGRRAAVWRLIVLASLLAIAAILGTWVNRQLLDNNSWTHASSKVIADPEVQNALSIYLTNQLYQNVDVTTAIEDRLPTNLQPLASPLAGLIASGGVSRRLRRLLRKPTETSTTLASGCAARTLR